MGSGECTSPNAVNYKVIYTELLNRATELQESLESDDLIPELNGIIEALSVISTIQTEVQKG